MRLQTANRRTKKAKAGRPDRDAMTAHGRRTLQKSLPAPGCADSSSPSPTLAVTSQMVGAAHELVEQLWQWEWQPLAAFLLHMLVGIHAADSLPAAWLEWPQTMLRPTWTQGIEPFLAVCLSVCLSSSLPVNYLISPYAVARPSHEATEEHSHHPRPSPRMRSLHTQRAPPTDSQPQ